jgi:hypothetical protein
MNSFVAACISVALGAAISSSGQDRPSLQILEGADGRRIEWSLSRSGAWLRYQLEQSSDLQAWEPVGTPLRSASSEGIVSRPIMPSDNLSFYRLSVFPETRVSALGQGGEDVFGYSDLFQTALQQIGQISPQQFQEKYERDIVFQPRLSWDPTTADFWDAFNVAPAKYNALLIDGLDDLRRFDFRLNEREMAVFRTNGFVVSESMSGRSCGEIYNRLWTDDLPVFITTDSVLQAWHRSYDMLLIDFEAGSLINRFNTILAAMAERVEPEVGGVSDALRPSLEDADYFLTVARSLLRGTQVPSKLGQDSRVTVTLESINAEKLDRCFELFGAKRAVDFSQFKPRGHYADVYALQTYFKTLMWLGRIDLRVAGGPFRDSECEETHRADPRELGTAIVLNQLLQDSGQFRAWSESEDLISRFVGWTDSMTFRELDPFLKANGVRTLADVTDTNILVRLQEALEIGSVGAQLISGDYFVVPFGGPPAALPQSFSFFGQKFVPDSWALSQLVADRILWVENGMTNKVMRRMPSALDVAFSVLGNDHTVPNLVERMTNYAARFSTKYPERVRDGLNYQHNLAAVREVIDQHPPSAWTQNIYMGWLDVLRQFSIALPQDMRTPEALRTHAWAMKDLNTQLASWTQLRHDTVLYAKQSYTGAFICSYPRGYVEPRVEIWNRLQALATRTGDLLRNSEIGATPGMTEFLAHFASVCGMLAEMSRKELAQEPFTQQEEDFISMTVVGHHPYASWRIEDGWYPKLFYRGRHSVVQRPGFGFDQIYGAVRWDPVVTDIHTNPPCGVCDDPGGVLHEAVGNVNLLMVAIENGTNRCIYAGPVLSHFEFVVPGDPQRLTDSDWQVQLAKAGLADYDLPEFLEYGGGTAPLPARPEWTEEYLVRKGQ